MNTEDIPTPITDNLLEQWDQSPTVGVLLLHARGLERDRSVLRKALLDLYEHHVNFLPVEAVHASVVQEHVDAAIAIMATGDFSPAECQSPSGRPEHWISKFARL